MAKPGKRPPSQSPDPDAAPLPVGVQLAQARRTVGLTQAELAARMGVSQMQVSRLEGETQRNYTLGALQRYVDALGGAYQLEVTIRPVDGPSTDPSRHEAPPASP
ncbi:MAG: helix-turn-helix domain-containing protein [Chloroflexota bacterium]|nr:helix-turn-helix domain-containing protein [Chloroflexota bacterium]